MCLLFLLGHTFVRYKNKNIQSIKYEQEQEWDKNKIKIVQKHTNGFKNSLSDTATAEHFIHLFHMYLTDIDSW